MLFLTRSVCLRLATAVQMLSCNGKNGLKRRELLLVKDHLALNAGRFEPSSRMGVVEARWGLSCHGPGMFRVEGAGEEGYPQERCPVTAGQGVCMGLGTFLAVYVPSVVDLRLLC